MADAKARRGLLAGALLAGFAIGIRSQTAVLTLPMLLMAMFRGEARQRIGAIGAFAAGVLLWGVPLIAASGGVSSYLEALGAQAGEDFSGVLMLWTAHSRRDIVYALVNTFVWPWDWWLGLAVCVLAAAGAARLAWRAPRALLTLLALFAPYAVFHLLFQETATTRYALPLLPVVAYARDGRGRRPAGTRIAGDGARHLRDLAGRNGSGVDQLRARRRPGLPRLRRHGGDRARRRSRDRHRASRPDAARLRVGGADPAGAGRARAARARMAGAGVAVEGGARRRASGSWPIPTAPIWRCSTPAIAIWRARTAGNSSSPPSSAGRAPTTSTGIACRRPPGCSIAAGRSPRKSAASPHAIGSDRTSRRRSRGCAASRWRRRWSSAGATCRTRP